MPQASGTPRPQNEVAGALTDEDFRHFDPRHRVDVCLEDLHFEVLTPLMEQGQLLYDEVEELRGAERARRAAVGSGALLRRKRPASDTLRERDPW